MLPFSNAALLKIEGPALSEDADRDEAPVVKWAGTVACFIDEKREQMAQSVGETKRVERFLILDTNKPGIPILPGDHLTYLRRGQTLRSKVTAFEEFDLPGHPLQTSRATLG